MPAAALAAGLALALLAWLFGRFRDLAGPPVPARRGALLLVVAASVLFRLPLAMRAAEGYTTADAALSGLVALHARDGVAHHVFVPSVPYSGSLKSHLAALLSLVPGLDLAQAFALASVLFYALFVAGAFRLAGLVARPGREEATALGAGLWAAFPPTFVTLYSLSNDGNYVEVLAFGVWALLLACRFLGEQALRPRLALGIGLLLGLGFWAHILAIIHCVAIGLALVLAGGRRAWRVLPALGAGFALGDLPGLIWNAANGWGSFLYLVPEHWSGAGRRALEPAGQGLLERLRLLLIDQAPVLFGYDPGYPPLGDALSRGFAWLGLLTAAAALLAAARVAGRELLASRRLTPLALLLLFVGVNAAVAVLALSYIPGNPRYVLFSFAVCAPLVAWLLDAGRRRLLLAALVCFGALGSLGQARAKLEDARAWRTLVSRLEAEGVRHCYSDFYQSARITFLSEERVLCSSKLGPTTTEYFMDYRPRVDAADDVAIVAVNAHSASRMERKLRELGVRYQRIDLVKPVLLRLSRRVDPSELFPGRELAPR
ncbi:MAG: hypothetical protein AB7O37_14505 [Vicinamibacteria bacterium]